MTLFGIAWYFHVIAVLINFSVGLIVAMMIHAPSELETEIDSFLSDKDEWKKYRWRKADQEKMDFRETLENIEKN